MRKHRQVFFRAFPEHTTWFQNVKVSKLRYFKKKFFFGAHYFQKMLIFGLWVPPKRLFFIKKQPKGFGLKVNTRFTRA